MQLQDMQVRLQLERRTLAYLEKQRRMKSYNKYRESEVIS